jgi:hypothetical protein
MLFQRNRMLRSISEKPLVGSVIMENNSGVIYTRHNFKGILFESIPDVSKNITIWSFSTCTSVFSSLPSRGEPAVGPSPHAPLGPSVPPTPWSWQMHPSIRPCTILAFGAQAGARPSSVGVASRNQYHLILLCLKLR